MFPFWPVGFMLSLVGGWMFGYYMPNIFLGVMCACAWGYFIGEIST